MRVQKLSGISFFLFLGAISASLTGCPAATTGVGPVAQEASGGSTNSIDQIQDQPSLPGGVVVMENDPHCFPLWEGEAEESLICRDADKGTAQIRLTGQLTLVHGKECPQPNLLMVVFNDVQNPQFLSIKIDENYRFDQTFEAQEPASFRFGLRSDSRLIASRVGEDGILPMQPCDGDSCSTLAPISFPMTLRQVGETADVSACSKPQTHDGVVFFRRPETLPTSEGATTAESQPSAETAPTTEVYQLVPQTPISVTPAPGVIQIVR